MKSAPLAALLSALFIAGHLCAAPPLNIRTALLASAKREDPDFPDGKNVLLTHFSHIGELTTADGKRIYAADRRAVLAGMAAPRGLNFICFFDARFHFLGKVKYASSRPLWCKGGKLFLWGELDEFDHKGNNLKGNVIDLTGGFSKLRVYEAYAYGSSGGILKD